MFYWRFFIGFEGELNFGNFVFPSNINQLYHFPIFWNHYYNGSTVSTNPQGTFFYLISIYTSYPIFAVYGANAASKFFIMFSTFIMGFSMYIFLANVGKYRISALIASIFFVFNPLFIQLIANGDFYSFFYFGMVILSYVFLINWLKSDHFISYNLLLSVLLFSFATSLYQLFLLGFLFTMMIFILFFLRLQGKPKTDGIILLIKKLIIYIGTLIIITLPFIVSTLSSVNALAGISSSLTLSNLKNNSTNVFNILIMKSYFPNISFYSVKLIAGKLIYQFWYYSIMIFLLLLFSGLFLSRKKKVPVMLTITTILIILFAAGPYSPTHEFNDYLFINLTVYRSLNTSYYWAWFILIPLYSLSILMVIDCVIDYRKFHFKEIQLLTRKFKLHSVKSTAFLSIFVVLLIIILIMPIATQGYYGNSYLSGIRSQNIPNSYNEGMMYLKNGSETDPLVEAAVFNPDYYLALNNKTSNNIINPVYTYQSIRVTGLPGYGQTSLSDNYYNYWLYSLFYANETSNIGQLFGISGVKYFIVLNNTTPFSGSNFLPNSFNTNASKIITYQKDMKLIDTENGYSIYSQNYNINEIAYINNYTLISGNYNTLNCMANGNINLTRLAVVFPDFQNYSAFQSLLTKTSTIILPSYNDLLGLLNPLLSNYSIPLEKLQNKSYKSQWNSSYYYNNNVASIGIENFYKCPENILVGNTGAEIKDTLGNMQSGNYTILLSLYNQKKVSGNISVSLNGNMHNINTSNFESNKPVQNLRWVTIPYNLTSNVLNLSIKSETSLNAIGSLDIVPDKVYALMLSHLKNSISSNNINLLLENDTSGNISFDRIMFNNSKNQNELKESIVHSFNVSSCTNIISPGPKIMPTSYGYKISSNKTLPILLRIPYSPDITSNIQHINLFPVFGGVDLGIETTQHSNILDLYAKNYILIKYAILFSSVLVSLYLIYPIFRRLKIIKLKN